MSTVIVSGPLANKTGNGGGAWERMSWVTGLRRLGCDVYFVEQIAPAACVNAAGAPAALTDSINLDWFRFVTEWFGVSDHSALVNAGGEKCVGVSWPQLLEIACSADLLVNLSGHLTSEPLLERIRRKVYIDVDPGFTQFWCADPNTPFHISGHDFYFTIGENIGLPGCTIPTGGVRWRPIRQPVVLDQWRVVNSPSLERFTTVASWRGAFGPMHAGGRRLGVKVHEFRKFMGLPQRVPATFEIALDIHPADQKDHAALDQNGWRLVNPRDVAGDPHAFRRYVQGSDAEFSVAQGIYVETNSGWFSDRSVRYLASGKPVLLQETGFSRNYPVGAGLLTFRTLDEAAAGAERIMQDYEKHCRAARRLAEEFFDSDDVLGRLLQEVGDSP
jgi:hypothetical protein